MKREGLSIMDNIWTLRSASMNFSDLQRVFIFFLLMPNKANFPWNKLWLCQPKLGVYTDKAHVPQAVLSNPPPPYSRRIQMHPHLGCSFPTCIETFSLPEHDNLWFMWGIPIWQLENNSRGQLPVSGGTYHTLQSMLHSGPSPILVSLVYWLAGRPHHFLTYNDLKLVNHTLLSA